MCFLIAAVFALSQVAFYFAFKFIVSSLDPTKAKRQEAKAKSNRVLGKLGVSRSEVYMKEVGKESYVFYYMDLGQGFEINGI